MLLFLLALLTSAGRLSATGWSEGLDLAAIMALAGALLGLALGGSRFRPWAVAMLATGYTVCVFPWALGINQYGGLNPLTPWHALAARFQHSFATLAAHQPLEDTLLFLTLVAFGYWLAGLGGGFFLLRRGSWVAATLPAGLALFVVHAFDETHPGGEAYLFFYLLAALLLLERLHFLARRADWQAGRVFLPPEAIHHWNQAILLVAVITLGLAWLLPAPAQAIGFAQRAWRQWTQDWQRRETDFSRFVAGLQTANQAAPYAGETLRLEQDAASDATIVFTVLLPPVDLVPRYYWRARVYDFYADGQWETRAAVSRQFSPAEAPLSLPDEAGNLSTYTFTLQMPSDWLFTPPRPLWVSVPLRLGLVPVTASTIDPLFFQGTLKAGQQYQVEALDFSPTEAQLRAAGQDYPAWVRERYLQLPADWSPRLRALATELTAAAATPYEKARRITDWLRASIRYSEHVPAPPPDRDLLEWFLLDYRQGFCTYAATAEVLLLRAVGVPARLAAGYAEGEIPPGTRRLRQVRQSHAHTWPEVYFPGLGWVEFEPTTSQSPLHRPAGQTEEVSPGAGQPTPVARTPLTPAGAAEGASGQPAGVVSPPKRKTLHWWLPLAGLMVLASGYLLWRKRSVRLAIAGLRRGDRGLWQAGPMLRLRLAAWRDRASQRIWARACAELYRAARRLGTSPSPAQTPLEVAALLRQQLPEAQADVEALLSTCLPAMYGTRPGDARLARQAAASLRHKSRRAAWQKRLHQR